MIIKGRVQGVGFRWTCQRQAQKLGLRGWVKNLADGSVEILAEGQPTSVERLVAWSRQGPPGAQVTECRLTSETALAAGNAFRILF